MPSGTTTPRRPPQGGRRLFLLAVRLRPRRCLASLPLRSSRSSLVASESLVARAQSGNACRTALGAVDEVVVFLAGAHERRGVVSDDDDRRTRRHVVVA